MFENDEINSRRAYQVAALGAIGVALENARNAG